MTPDRPRDLVAALEGQFDRYKRLAEGAMDQLDEGRLTHAPGTADNSVATIAWHVAGNLTSRFTDFLTTDGEKPWREREDEFAPRHVDAATLRARWEEGWAVLFDALAGLDDDDLTREVTIRGVPLPVHTALLRALAHASYHVGQIVYLAKSLRGDGWSWLSIPPGGTEEYNRNPTQERAEGGVRPES